MISRGRVLPLLFLLAACGDDGGSPPDAGPPDAEPPPPDAMVPACTELDDPAGTIASYPGSFSGSIVGAGANLVVAQGVCTVEESYYAPIGEDAVVALTGLTIGTEYGVIVDAVDDLSFYVVTGCDEAAGGPAAGQCAVFDDRTTRGEAHVFTPAAADAFVVVDTAEISGQPETGDFTMRVVEVECESAAECADPTPICFEFGCVECDDDFDCGDPASPVCDATSTCVAGPAQCTGDDAGDTAGSDDGPAGARALAVPATTITPTTETAAVCSLPAGEADWYELTVTGAATYGFELSYTDAVDLDLALLDATGSVLVEGEAFLAGLAPGTYYLVTTMVAPADTAAASSYTLTLRRAECVTSFDCPLSTEPLCSASGVCGAGPIDCTGDDEGDTTPGGDDGPAGARSLTGAVDTPVALTGAVCNVGAGETDFYTFTVLQGEGMVLDLTWDNAGRDLDLYAQADDGTLLGLAFWRRPEQVTLTYLPAGTYYLQVALYSTTPIPEAEPYTITATRTLAQVCAGPADCAAEYADQLFRGDCAAGACEFIAPGAAATGALCDSSDDCLSGLCSYVSFEADAHESLCTEPCTTTADCVTVGAGLTCTSGSFGMCVPTCASNLDCGANPYDGGLLEPDHPWHYYACNTAIGVCSI